MICDALVTGVENVKGESKKDGKPYDFWKVNFIDTKNPSGSPQNMTLPKDPTELLPVLKQFQDSRMKQLSFHVYQNGNFLNFGGFLVK